jgi:hypothetical protein
MMAGILSWFWKSEDNSLEQVTELVERQTVTGTDLKHFTTTESHKMSQQQICFK